MAEPAAEDRGGPALQGWGTQQLAEFSHMIALLDDEPSTHRRGVEHVAEVLDAEVAALAVRGEIVAAVGFAAEGPDLSRLAPVLAGEADLIMVEGVGECHACVVPSGDPDVRLVVGRAEDVFQRAELGLLRGMALVLAMGLRTLRLIESERKARLESERRAAENQDLVAALRERQGLLERLSSLQRAIVERQPSHQILNSVAEGLDEILGTGVVGVRLRDRDDAGHLVLAASVGSEEDLLPEHRRTQREDGLAARAMRAREPVRVAPEEASAAGLVSDFARQDVAAALAAPVWERGEIVGALLVGSPDPERVFTARDEQALLAFAEHASLALGHARSVADSLREAFRDPLTGLPNRALFMDRLEVALARAERASTSVSVLFCDLDGFKTLNDSLGMTVGDRVLRLVAGRLRGCLRPSDTLARLGGDEFGVLLEDTGEENVSEQAAQRMLDALEAPFRAGDREIFLGASIGIAGGDSAPGDLLRDADLAMYRAKAEGKGRFVSFEPHMHRAAVERLELEVDLKRALARDEMSLAYQPVFDLVTGRIAGLEALVRWQHPERGLILPDDFIPLAEESGQIMALGRWVLRTACQQGALWRARYPALEGLQVGVNISAAQLREAGLVDEVREALAAAQLDADGLTLEITESSLMEDPDACSRRLGMLKSLGVEVAIDDFGTGYSSLSHLRRFPLDNLKIDRSFVAEIGSERQEPALLQAVVDLAEAFGLAAVAEGIERREQLQRLLDLGCRLGQGNVLSPPLSASDADALLLNAGLLGSPLEVLDQRPHERALPNEPPPSRRGEPLA